MLYRKQLDLLAHLKMGLKLAVIMTLVGCSPVQFKHVATSSENPYQNYPPREPDLIALPPTPDHPSNSNQPTPHLPTPELVTKLIYEAQYPKQTRELNFEQKQLEKNETTILFQVRNSNNQPVHQLTAYDFLLMEDNLPIHQFNFDSSFHMKSKIVDIVFAVDVTGSMGPSIESAKRSLIRFVQDTRQKGYHTRMCTLTFGDYTVKHCHRFFNNNPSDPSTQSEVNELINEITSLRAINGPNNPGGLDYNENPMGALIDASRAPWGENHLRYVILITDDGFLYSPSNQGSIGKKAPFMHQVHSAIQSAQMKIFAVTPSMPGYNSDFRVVENGKRVTYSSIVHISNGRHYEFTSFINQQVSLDSVLSDILVDALTTYRISFWADDERAAHLPLNQRKISVQFRQNRNDRILIQSVTSNLPEGRAEYPKSWPIGSELIDTNYLKVFLDQVDVTQQVIYRNYTIHFGQPPKPRSKIQIYYRYLNNRLNFDIRPIRIDEPIAKENLRVLCNQIPITPNDFSLRTVQNDTFLEISDSIFNDPQYFANDPNHLLVHIYYVTQSSK